jgi:hypothetical protein
MTMNVKNLKKLVEALEALPENIREDAVDMTSESQPSFSECGCHAGMFEILDLKEITELYLPPNTTAGAYSYSAWADAVAMFLGFCDNIALSDWAKENPKIWGNSRGSGMFCEGEAFGLTIYDHIFPRQIIITHWRKVLNRIEAKL